jgi:hypothetical protein
VEKMEDGTELPLPPVLLGQIGTDPVKKTVLLYGHLDVQPAQKVELIMITNAFSYCAFVIWFSAAIQYVAVSLGTVESVVTVLRKLSVAL